MMLPKVPMMIGVNRRLFHQSYTWTLASLASARPKWKTLEAEELIQREEENCPHKEDKRAPFDLSGIQMKNQHQHQNAMGSFYSQPCYPIPDTDNEEPYFPPTSPVELLARCKSELQDLPVSYERTITRTDTSNKERPDGGGNCLVRILQWNILAQALGTNVDQFVRCDPSALEWATRRWRILEEVVQHSPSIIALQEVDHYDMLSRALGSIGYQGRFLAKPDSACVYQDPNTGPDGCAIFYQDSVFSCTEVRTKVLEVWGSKTNQVVLMIRLIHKETRKELCVATTHLKARRGDLLSTIRDEQGKDVLQFLQKLNEEIPIILTGDFNDEPTEPVYKTITGNERIPLISAYKIREDVEDEENDKVLEYTTWKIRETGEEKSVHDYIFHSPELETVSTLDMPSDHQVGKDRLPSLQFASDHLSLVADIRI